MAEHLAVAVAPQRFSTIRAGHGVVPHTTGFWFVAAAFVSLQAFGTVPTPLWPLYAVRDGLSPTTVTLAFACMVVGAGTSLYLFGHLSDRVGRRRIIVPALAFGITAAAVMAWWPTLPGWAGTVGGGTPGTTWTTPAAQVPKQSTLSGKTSASATTSSTGHAAMALWTRGRLRRLNRIDSWDCAG
jgi:MFS family permease